MITHIEISNINSIRNCSVDFNKAKYHFLSEMVYENDIVNPIAFYGSNGSGKSSFLLALAWLVNFMIEEPANIIAFTPNFVSNPENGVHKVAPYNNNSRIQLVFKLNNVVYDYTLETSIESVITYEQLIKDGAEIFSRTIEQYKYKNKFFDVKSRLFPVLRTLSIEQNNRDIVECFNFISNIGYMDCPHKSFITKLYKQKSYMDVAVERSKDVKQILSQYKDFPLYDMLFLTNEVGKKNYCVKIEHETGDLLLPVGLMSQGMHNQSVMLATLLSLPENGVLLVDEIESALHPLTILDFLKVVQERHIQLIFSSHNTFVLQSLRPDQIFFANWSKGYSTYKKLSDIYPNIREVNNIEKMYLSNLFDEAIKKDE